MTNREQYIQHIRDMKNAVSEYRLYPEKAFEDGLAKDRFGENMTNITFLLQDLLNDELRSDISMMRASMEEPDNIEEFNKIRKECGV